MSELARITARDDDGSSLVFTLTGGEPAWIGTGREDASTYALSLSTLFSMRNSSPADGQPGWDVAHAAAKWLKERVGFPEVALQLPQQPEGGPEKVY